MPVSKEITRLEKSSVRLTLTVPQEEVASGYRGVLGEYVKNAQVPGFRKGKAPPEVLERKFGEALRGEALGRIIEKALEEAFDEEKMPPDERPLPYSQPRLEGEPELALDRDMVLSLTYDARPSVSVGRWQGLKAEAPTAEVTEEDVARELEAVRERNSFVIDREDGAAAREGDVVTVDYCEIGEGGEPVPGSEREDFAFTLGKGAAFPELEANAAGMAKGQAKEFEIAGADPAEGEAAGGASAEGGAARMRLTVKAVKERKLPELDDELAQDVDEKFQTLEDLRKSLRERLEASLEARLRELRIGALLEKIKETAPVELPESMIRAEIGGRVSALGRNFGMQPEAVMRMLSAGGGGLEDLESRWRPSAEKALHSSLVVQALLDEQKIEADDEELREELGKIAAGAGVSQEELSRRYEDRQLELLRDGIRERKLFDLLLSANEVSDGARVAYLDLMADSE